MTCGTPEAQCRLCLALGDRPPRAGAYMALQMQLRKHLTCLHDMQDTGDTRETPAIDVCHGLIADDARLAIYDPQVKRDQIFRCARLWPTTLPLPSPSHFQRTASTACHSVSVQVPARASQLPALRASQLPALHAACLPGLHLALIWRWYSFPVTLVVRQSECLQGPGHAQVPVGPPNAPDGRRGAVPHQGDRAHRHSRFGPLRGSP